MCRVHYREWVKATPKSERPRSLALRKTTPKGPCSFKGCDKTERANGLCPAHTWQLRYKGELSPLRIYAPTMEARLWEKVLKTPDCWEWNASRYISGYGCFRKTTGEHMSYAHRVAYEMEHGPIPEGMMLDHICRNRGCVRPSHLRLATPEQNAQYRVNTTPNNQSVYRGVTKRGEGKYIARVRQEQIGTYPTREAAAYAAWQARNEQFDFPEPLPHYLTEFVTGLSAA